MTDSSMKKRVLLIAPQPFFQWRGSPIRVAFDVLALTRMGFDVDLLTPPMGLPKPIRGARHIRPPNLFLRRDLSIGPSLWKAAYDGLLLLWAVGLALRRRYAVVHGVEEAGLIAWMVGRLSGARVVFEKHSDPMSHRAGGFKNLVLHAYAAVERFTARHADAAIGTGPGLVEQLRRAGAVVAHLIPDIPSSLAEADAGRAAAFRAAWGCRPSDVVIVYVGSFAAYQGVELLFEAIPRVLNECSNARFVVIGGAPDEISSYREWAERRGVGARVVLPGKIAPDELPHALAAADILLSPRLAGINTPLKLLDYLKAGRAIAATDTPANRLILDGELAAFAAPDPAAYAEAIVALARDPARRRAMAARGRTLIEETHNLEEFSRRLERCYRGIGARCDERGF